MALLEIFGFDNGAGNRMDATFNVVTDRAASGNPVAGRYASDGLVTIDYARVPGNTGFRGRIALFDLTTPATEIIMGCDIQPVPSGLGDRSYAEFLEAGSGVAIPPATALTRLSPHDRKVIAALDYATGAIRFHRGRTNENFDWLWWGGTTTLLAQTGPGAINATDPYAHFEFRFDLTTDTIEVRKDGTVLLLASGVGMGGGTFNRAGYSRNHLGDFSSLAIDNLYVLSTAGGVRTTYIPDARVCTYLPTADAGPNAWIPLVPGPNFQMVDDVRLAPPPPQLDIFDQDASYVESAVAGDRELYFFTPTVPTQDIYGVQFYAYFRDMSGLGSTVNLVAVSPEAIPFVFGPYSIPAGYVMPGDATINYLGVRSPVMEVDPVTGLNWVDARLALWKFGFENVSGNQVRATQIAMAKVATPFTPPTPSAASAPVVGGGGRAVQYKAACAAPPSEWDRCLADRAEIMQKVNERAVCNPAPPPWREPPAGARRFQQVGRITLPGVEGADFLVLQWTVDPGHDGIITTITNLFTGAGYVNGSGDLIWRLMVDNQWIKDLDAIDLSVGRPSMPFKIKGAGYRVQSHQTLRYYVQLGSGALSRLDPSGNVICGLFGWIYPRGGER